MATLTNEIDKNRTNISITDPATTLAQGDLLRLDNEVLRFLSYGWNAATRAEDTGVWLVDRGVGMTKRAVHAIGTAVTAAADSFASAAFTSPPGNFDITGASDAASVSYDNTESEADAENVQAGLDELFAAGGGGGVEVFLSETQPAGPFPSGALWAISDPLAGAGSLQLRVWDAVGEAFESVGLADGLAGSAITWTGFSANGTEGNATLDFGGNPDGLIELHLRDEDGANDRYYSLDMGNSRIELSYYDPDAASPYNAIVMNDIGIVVTGLLGLFGAPPVAQGAAIADATDEASAVASLNLLLAYLRSRGDIAT